MITWSEFVTLVNIKIDEMKVSGKEPEIEYIDFSWVTSIEDISVTINKDNRLEIC